MTDLASDTFPTKKASSTPSGAAVAPSPVAFNRLNAWDIVLLLTEVVAILRNNGLLVVGTDGHAHLLEPDSPTQIATVASAVEALLKQHGVTVPANIDKIIVGLPVLLPLIGLK